MKIRGRTRPSRMKWDPDADPGERCIRCGCWTDQDASKSSVDWLRLYSYDGQGDWPDLQAILCPVCLTRLGDAGIDIYKDSWLEARRLYPPRGRRNTLKKRRSLALTRVLRILRQHRADLNELGVIGAAVFGSVARGDNRPDSDVDILVEFRPGLTVGLLHRGRLQQRLEKWIGRPVDVADREIMRPHVQAEADRDAVIAF